MMISSQITLWPAPSTSSPIYCSLIKLSFIVKQTISKHNCTTDSPPNFSPAVIWTAILKPHLQFNCVCFRACSWRRSHSSLRTQVRPLSGSASLSYSWVTLVTVKRVYALEDKTQLLQILHFQSLRVYSRTGNSLWMCTSYESTDVPVVIKHHAMKTHNESGGTVQLILTWTLERNEWSASAPGMFTPRDTAPGTL
jgi:hypothetical protein